MCYLRFYTFLSGSCKITFFTLHSVILYSYLFAYFAYLYFIYYTRLTLVELFQSAFSLWCFLTHRFELFTRRVFLISHKLRLSLPGL